MHTISRILIITGLVLTVGLQPSWGGAPPNNDTSNQGNIAGGTDALQSNTTGTFNTASGSCCS